MTEKLYTKGWVLITSGYTRIVSSNRGSYYEFDKTQIKMENLVIPDDELWRIHSQNAYYVEFRTKDKSRVKIYSQKKKVKYADYKIGFFYVNVNDISVIISVK
jgi:hypothetical protein